MLTGYVGQRRHQITTHRKRHRDRLRQLWRRHYVSAKPFLPYVGFAFYAVAGALVIHVIELRAEMVPDNRSPDGIKCLRDHGFWAALFYVISVCSTIGFGVIYPCTTPTRVLSVIYSFVGIPLVLYILSDLGKRMCIVVTTVYTFFHRKFRVFFYRRQRFRRNRLCTVLALSNCVSLTPRYNQSYEPNEVDIDGVIPYVDDDSTYRSNLGPQHAVEEEFTTPRTAGNSERDDTLDNFLDPDIYEDSLESDEIVDVPISIGLIMLFVCMNLCTLFYYNTECYYLWESVYYSLLTFLSGDFITTHFEWSAPVYIIIFLGFSTLTMTVTIVQNNMQNMLTRVKREVQREMIKKQEIAEATGGVLDEDDAVDAEERMNDFIRKQGMSWMTSDKEAGKLEHFVKEAAQKRNASTQTPTDRKPPVAKRTVGTTYRGAQMMSRGEGTDGGQASHGTNTQHSATTEAEMQFDENDLRLVAACQSNGPHDVKHTDIQTDKKPVNDKAVAVQPKITSWSGQTVPVGSNEKGNQNSPVMRHASVQMTSDGRGSGWRAT